MNRVIDVVTRRTHSCLVYPLLKRFHSTKTFVEIEGVHVATERIRRTEERPMVYKKWLPLTHHADIYVFYKFQEDPFYIPKIYAALDHFTGPKSKDYDPYKGSFGFRFWLDVEKDGHSSLYIYGIMQYRRSSRISVYQGVDKSDPRRSEYYTDPTENLFSKRDISLFSLRYIGELLEKLSQLDAPPRPFILPVESEGIISGYLEGKYFLEYFEDYEKGLNDLRAKIKKEREFFEEEAKRKMVIYGSNFQKDNKTEMEKVAGRMLLHNYSVEEISRLTDLEETMLFNLQTAVDAFENQERS